jgi:hypothetical protein
MPSRVGRGIANFIGWSQKRSLTSECPLVGQPAWVVTSPLIAEVLSRAELPAGRLSSRCPKQLMFPEISKCIAPFRFQCERRRVRSISLRLGQELSPSLLLVWFGTTLLGSELTLNDPLTLGESSFGKRYGKWQMAVSPSEHKPVSFQRLMARPRGFEPLTPRSVVIKFSMTESDRVCQSPSKSTPWHFLSLRVST